MTTLAAEKTPQTGTTEIKSNGYIFTLRTARKNFTSCVSRQSIGQGTRYYTVILGGGGLGWIKRPDRILVNEIDLYIEKWGNAYKSNP